jgi:putative copper export protein
VSFTRSRPRPLGGRDAARLLVALGVATVLLGVGAVWAPSAAWAQGVALDTAGRGTEVGLWTARLANHLALAATVGLLLVPAWLLRSGPIGPTGRAAARTAAVTAVLWALSAAAVLVFGLSNAAARPLPEALDGALLGRFLGTRFGSAVAAQSVAALLAAGLSLAARNRSGARLALGVVLLAAAGPAWWGHAGTADLRAVALLSDWLHVAAASIWVGGLVALLVLVRRRPVDPHGPTERFSSLAGWAILVVAATGVVNVVLHTTAPIQLVDTTWGRAALGKALLAALLGGLGWVHRRRIIPRLRTADGGAAARGLFVRLAAVELVVMLGAFGLATTMASGVPANVEAASRIQMFTIPLGEGLVEVSLDPARTGRNELHVYLYDAQRALRPVDAAEVVLEDGETEVVPRLVPSGPGHFTAPAVEVPSPGAYRVRISVEVDGGVEEATGAVTVR